MRDPQGERVPWFYHLAVVLVRLLLRLFSRHRLVGLERVPLRGPLLVVSNHQNAADPPILIAAMPRVIHMMAKQELFEGPLGLLSRRYGAFPVRRGQSDREAIRTALDYLGRGSCVGMFPEGTRSRTGALQEGKTGAGLLAVRSGCPILPVALVGTRQLRGPLSLLKRPQIEVVFGEPFALPPHQGVGRSAAAADATELMMRRIAELLPPEMRGVYAQPPTPVGTREAT